jgi:hypothetical protein
LILLSCAICITPPFASFLAAISSTCGAIPTCDVSLIIFPSIFLLFIITISVSSPIRSCASSINIRVACAQPTLFLFACGKARLPSSPIRLISFSGQIITPSF